MLPVSLWLRPVIVPAIALLFNLLPVRVSPKNLIQLAFALWMMGGIALSVTGVQRLMETSQTADATTLIVALALTVAVGVAKGRFVLGKTSARNIERLQALTSPQKLVQVYSLRSWILIEVMLLLSASLTWFAAPIFWRGIVNLGVGLALIMSSLAYLNVSRSEGNPAPSAS